MARAVHRRVAACCARRVPAGRGRRGAAVFRSILDARDPALAPPESELELQAQRLLQRAGITPLAQQQEVVGPDGRRYRLDFVFPGRKALEANGRAWHSGRADLERNDRKQRQLALLGYRVLPFGWIDVRHRRTELVAEIRAFLAS